MPPVTRRSQAGSGSGVAKKVTRKRALQAVTRKESDSWNFINTSNDNVREFVEDHSEQEEQLAIESPADVEEAVNPLREMADRVGQEVERFAVSLDAFLNDLPTRQDKYKAAMDVATEFKDIAKRRVRELEKSHQKERAQQLRKEWSEQAHLSPADGAGRQVKASSTGTLSTRKAEEVQELRHWQQEADVWELFRLMLQLSYRKDLDTLDRERQQEREEKLARLEQPHRYTTEAELYERFLVENDIARERSLIKKWLEQTIDHQESGLPGIMEELEAKSGSGKGLWSQGWMNTREHIKGEKRLRTWPSPSDSVQPQIRTSAGTDMLVTTLDPDAPSRQQRALEQPDSFYEKAMWITCWEMLRRGKPWEEIKQWCEERNEGWRAVAINAIGATDALSNGAWRKMCYLASESGCSNDYEAAVYGLLGGNAKAVEKVCRTVDDHLYANYSCILVHQFEQYLQQYYPDRVPAVAINRGPVDEVFEDKDQAQDATYNIIKKLRKGTTKEESVKPMKIIESYLINNAAEDMIYTMGMAASDLDSLRGGQDTTIYRFRQPPAQLSPEAQVVLDNHALRIAAHIYVVTRAIDEGKPKAETVGAEENVLAAYIQSLRAAGVRDSAPLYASRMQRERYILTMGNVLQDVSNPTEQKEILSLMQSHYDMDVVAIFTEQLNFILSQRVSIAAAPDRPLRILEDTKTTNLYPGQRIMEDFMPDTLEETDVALVRSLQWFELLRGQWQVTFSSLSLALRKALVTGRFGCALEIVRNFPYESISYSKSEQVIRKSVNLMEKTVPWPEEGTEAAIQWALLKRQSRTYYELEQLVRAISSLSEWANVEREYTDKPRAASTAPPELRDAKAALDEAMAPLLTGILRHPMDEAEAADLEQIRKTYLPEIIIAYNTALYTAGPTITRDSYIEVMDLSVAIADEATGLTECFVQAGRMQELVTSFAQTSKLMLVMKANGRPRKAHREGKDLGLWEIGPQGQGVIAGTADADVS